MIGRVVDLALRGVARALAVLPKNEHVWAYTIRAKDGVSPYMTRVLFPRVLGRRVMLHRIHTPDADRDLHNHPWAHALSIVLTGGYVEERLDWDLSFDGLRGVFAPKTRRILRRPLTAQRLDSDDYHRVESVLPRTWTLFLAGPRVQSWGFLVPGPAGLVKHVDFDDYFARRGHAYEGVRS